MRPKRSRRGSEGLTIGQLASLIGMAPSAMRFYEDKGLVAPEKRDDNSYRSYLPAESCGLLMARLYQSFGLGLDRTAAILGKGEHDQLMTALDERGAEIEAEIERLVQAKRALEGYRRECAAASGREGKLEIVSLPAMKYLFTIDSGYALDEPERAAIVRSWTARLPGLSYSLLIPEAAFLGLGSLSCRWGFGLEGAELDREERDFAELRPPAECVALSLLREAAGMIKEGELEPLRSRFAETGFKPAGDVSGRFIEIVRTASGLRYLYRIYIPFYR